MGGDDTLQHAVIRDGSAPHSLDSYYDLRSAFPDYIHFFEQWRERSDDVRRKLPCVLDVSYGDGERNRVDIFPADNPDGRLFTFIHGGYWRSMDKSDFSFIALPFLRRNVSVALINYSLFPGTTMPEVVNEVRSACAWIAASAPRYGVPCKKLHLGGWSAGAHLATMVAALEYDTRLVTTEFASVLAISGVFDLRPLLRTSANADLKLDEKVAVENSPRYLRPRRGQRVTLLWGANETDAFREQSRALFESWQDKGADIRAEEVSGFHHYSVMNELEKEGSRVLRHALALLNEGIDLKE
jgi:arylformamidase